MLKRFVEHNQHTTIIAPRRFGKTSLIRKVLDENKPSMKLVDLLWEEFMYTRKSSIRDELESLKMSDRRLLKSLCLRKTKEPMGLEYSQYSLVPASTAGRSIKELINKDFIYINHDGYYQPIDPTYQSFFKLFG